MTNVKQLMIVVVTLASMAGLATSAHAQFSFGGVQFGGSSRSSHGVSATRQIQSVIQQAWRQETQPPTDMRYRGPMERKQPVPPRHVVIGKGPFTIAIDPQVVLANGGYGQGIGCRPAPCPDPQPCPTPGPAPIDPTPEPIRDADPALELTYAAQQAFLAQDYITATAKMDRVLELSPESAAAYQFRGLTQFAQGNYDAAAADVYEALLRGPLWTWDTLHPLYADPSTYTGQYHALSRAAKHDETSLAKHFLLACHHLMLGHLEHGEKQLEKALQIQPNEPVTTQLLGVVQDLRGKDSLAAR